MINASVENDIDLAVMPDSVRLSPLVCTQRSLCFNERGVQSQPAIPSNPDSKTILIVEDDSAIRQGLEIFLRKIGYRTESAENGQVGLKLAGDSQVDLIIADIRMPVLDGLKMLHQLKMDQSLKGIPVIMLSASPGDQRSALDAGAVRFIRKPFDHRLLKMEISTVLQI